MIKFKVKGSAIVATPGVLGNISKDWLVDNMKKTGIYAYAYEYSVDYQSLYASNISKTISVLHKYLIAKYKIR